MQGTIFFSFLLFAINKAYFLLNPRNIISNIIMIFNINSTRGHTGSLLVGYCGLPVKWGITRHDQSKCPHRVIIGSVNSAIIVLFNSLI